MTIRTLFPVLLAAPLAAWGQGDYPACRAALEADVGKRFSQSITSIDWRLVETRGRPDLGMSSALVYVAECPGYHYYEIAGTSWQCAQSAGTSVVLNYRSSGDGC